MPIEWPRGVKELNVVYCGEFAKNSEKTGLHMLGRSIPMRGALVRGLEGSIKDDDSMPEVGLYDETMESSNLLCLAQVEGVVFSDSSRSSGNDDFQLVSNMRSLEAGPKWWDPEGAVWPCHDGRPLPFVGQLSVVGAPWPQELFVNNAIFYLFGSRHDAGSHLRVVEQACNQRFRDHWEKE